MTAIVGDKPFAGQIREFNRLYNLPVNDSPTIPFTATPEAKITEQLIARLKQLHAILIDEVNEVTDIIYNVEAGRPPVEILTELADWLGDLQVYCASEMCKFGIENQVILSIIMASNMSKLNDDGSVIMKDGKVEKGPNYWKPEPMVRRYLEAAIRQASKANLQIVK